MVDPPKGTLVPRVQLTTEADEVVAKRCGYLALNFYSRYYVNSGFLLKCTDELLGRCLMIGLNICADEEASENKELHIK
ncbi:hypothetical protein Tco_1357609, partial [Tanacetum coccineum]